MGASVFEFRMRELQGMYEIHLMVRRLYTANIKSYRTGLHITALQFTIPTLVQSDETSGLWSATSLS